MDNKTPHPNSASPSSNIPGTAVLTNQDRPASEDTMEASASSANNPNHLLSNPLTVRLAFTVRETAELLGISEKSVRRLIARGLLRPSRALRHLLIPKKQIERFLDVTVAEPSNET
jgi:excisionase family DNA binding protein